MIRAPSISTVRPVMGRTTVPFKAVPMVLAHGRGKAVLEWAGVLAFTGFMVAVSLWVLANPAGSP